MRTEMIPPVSLAITQGFVIFSTFLPDLADIRRANLDNDPEFAADVRCGEAAASVLIVGAGAMVSYVAQTPAAILASITTALALVSIYEFALRGRPFSMTGDFNG